MATAGDKIQFSNFSSDRFYDPNSHGWWIVPPRGSSNNSWGNHWYHYIYCNAFVVGVYATYRWLNQPYISIEYYYYNNGNWVSFVVRDIEGNRAKREAIFGHNMEVGQQFGGATGGGVDTVYFDWHHSEKHLWQIRTRRYRNSDWGDGRIWLYGTGAMGETRYNSYLKGAKIQGIPKTSFSVGTSTSGNSIILFSDNVSLPATTVYNYFHTNQSQGSSILASQDWRATTMRGI